MMGEGFLVVLALRRCCNTANTRLGGATGDF